MRKFTLLIVFALFIFNSKSLMGQNTRCKFTFVDSSSLLKNDLYKPIRVWISKTFIDSKSVIQMDDKDLGKIICKGVIPVDGTKNFLGSPVGDDYVYFTLTVDIKDYKYRLVFDDIFHKAGHYSGSHSGGDLCNDKPKNGGALEFSIKRWNKIQEKIASIINSYFQEIKDEIEKNSSDDF